MCHNQLGRRNVTDEQRTVLIGEAYKAQKKSHGASGGFRGNQHSTLVSHQNDDLPNRARTADKIAKTFSVGKATVERAEYFLDGLNAADEIAPGFRNRVLAGEIKVSKKDVSEIRKMEPEEKK